MQARTLLTFLFNSEKHQLHRHLSPEAASQASLERHYDAPCACFSLHIQQLLHLQCFYLSSSEAMYFLPYPALDRIS